MYLSAKTTLLAFCIFCEIYVTFAPLRIPFKGIFKASSSGKHKSPVYDSIDTAAPDDDSKDDSSESDDEEEDGDKVQDNGSEEDEDPILDENYHRGLSRYNTFFYWKNPNNEQNNAGSSYENSNAEENNRYYNQFPNNDNNFWPNYNQLPNNDNNNWQSYFYGSNNDNHYWPNPYEMANNDNNRSNPYEMANNDNNRSNDEAPDLGLEEDLGCKAAVEKMFKDPEPVDNLIHAFYYFNENKFNTNSPNYKYTHGYYMDLIKRATKTRKSKIWSPGDFCGNSHKKDLDDCLAVIWKTGLKEGSNGLQAYTFMYLNIDYDMLNLNFLFPIRTNEDSFYKPQVEMAKGYFMYLFNRHGYKGNLKLQNLRNIDDYCSKEFKE